MKKGNQGRDMTSNPMEDNTSIRKSTELKIKARNGTKCYQ
jgi:hypothetical protein